jgi:hypothetical protein
MLKVFFDSKGIVHLKIILEKHSGSKTLYRHIEDSVFWDIMLSCMLKVSWCFRGMCYLHC